ncbi:HAMP domain-containing protein [bacterium]|nr:HAMP domain-containing protein [bacterium]
MIGKSRLSTPEKKPAGRMSIRWRLLITLGVLIVLGTSVVATATVGIILNGAKIGTSEWFTASKNSLDAVVHEEIEEFHEHSYAMAMDPDFVSAVETGDLEGALDSIRRKAFFLSPDNIWVILPAANQPALTNQPDCENPSQLRRELRLYDRGFFHCGDSLFLGASARSDQGSIIVIGLIVGDAFADDMSRITNTEIAIYDGGRLVATSAKNIAGERVEPGFPAEFLARGLGSPERIFHRLTIRIPDYGGYLESHGAWERGESGFSGFAMIDNLDSEHPETGAKIAFAIPSVFMEIGAWYSAATIVGVAFITAIFVFVATLRNIRKVTRPIVELSRAADAVAGGRTDVEVPVNGASEIALLAESFNSMVRRLADSRAQLVQADKLAAIGQLAGGVAHEINNPLAVIFGFAQVLDRRIAASDPLRMPVDSILREAERCRNLVQELVTFSRTAKKTRDRIDVNEIIERSLILLETRAKSQHVAINREFGADLPHVDANRTQFEQILVNLGTNAFDAMPNGGILILRTLADDSGAVVVEVSDTGTGIESDVVRHVFDPFFTTKEVGKGTGLGLSLVYEIVQQHGGRIDLDTEIGRGTTFRISLPGAPAPAIQGSAA